MSLEQQARAFATGAHAGQTYGLDGRPYTEHLGGVVSVLYRWERFRRDAHLLAAGWLHDTIEDTKVDYAAIFGLFGGDVANMVDAVTDRPGKNRREKHEATYPMVRYIGGDRAAWLKLADRIANVEYSRSTKDKGKLKMYRGEQAEFKRLLGTTQVEEEVEMWKWLDTLLETP